MKVLDEGMYLEVAIEYNLTEKDRTNTFRYLDNRFGKFGYQIIKLGPNGVDGKGLIIVKTGNFHKDYMVKSTDGY